MKHKIILNIERLPDGVFLATSPDVKELAAQGRTFNQTIEIAQDVVMKIFEAKGMTISDGELEFTVNSSVRKC